MLQYDYYHRLANDSPRSHSYNFFLVVKTFKFYLLSNFDTYKQCG